MNRSKSRDRTHKKKENLVSKTKYPAVTRDFSPSVSHELPSDCPQTYYNDEEKPTMSRSTTAVSFDEAFAEALANVPSKPVRMTHLNILTSAQWGMLQEARRSNPKAGLQGLFNSMKQAYSDNDKGFFKDYAQFYNTYRQAVKVLGLEPVKVKSK